MIFDENDIPYGQDFRFCRGIPAGVDFRVEAESSGRYKLTAPGYGERGDYGNGSLHVSAGRLTQQWAEAFEAAAKTEQEAA